MDIERNIVHLGYNLEIIKTFPDHSIDSIVTDPPYGLGKEPKAELVLKDWLEKGYLTISGKGFMGKEWDSFVPQPNFWKECHRVLKPGGHVLSFAGTRTYDWVVMGLRLAGFEIRDQIIWAYGSGFPKSHDVSKAIDKMLGAEREVVGSKISGISNKNEKHHHTIGAGKSVKVDITIPSTEEAKKWQGWGSALKPALEPIVMARKPLDGTIAQNVLKHGVGGINIDGCRVENGDNPKSFIDNGREANGVSLNWANTDRKERFYDGSNGRFPANIIHDGSEDVESAFPKTDVDSPSRFFEQVDYTQEDVIMQRIFYTAKASQHDRNWGLGGFESKFTASAEFRPNHMEKAVEGDNENPYGRWQPKKNIHPTVKPIDLMRYLVRLVTPKGGLCLDPYMGSGTTAVACKAEKIDYIGIEREKDYVKISNARIKAEVVTFDIFDFMGDEDK